VPGITAAGLHTLAWILTGFVAVSALLGILFAPSNAGKSLKELEGERTSGRRFVRERDASSPQRVT
jgi:inositol transporter-like SP family MFS transporter